jgi:hypothetical protein
MNRAIVSGRSNVKRSYGKRIVFDTSFFVKDYVG